MTPERTKAVLIAKKDRDEQFAEACELANLLTEQSSGLSFTKLKRLDTDSLCVVLVKLFDRIEHLQEQLAKLDCKTIPQDVVRLPPDYERPPHWNAD